MFVPIGALCFLMALFVVDAGLPDDAPKEEVTTPVTEEDQDEMMTGTILPDATTRTEKLGAEMGGGDGRRR